MARLLLITALLAAAAACALAGAGGEAFTRPGEARMHASFSPQDVDALVAQANEHYQQGRMDEAEQHLRLVLQLSRQAGSPRDLAGACYMLAQHLLRVRGSRAEIIELLQTVLRINPNHSDARHWLGHQLSRIPEREEEVVAALSRVDLERLTSANPLDTLMLLGQALERRSRPQDSARAFSRACELLYATDPNSPRTQSLLPRFALAHVQLCRQLLELGDTDQALTVSSRAVAQFPASYQVLDLHAVVLYRATQSLARARDHYHAMLRGPIAQWPPAYRHVSDRAFGATLAWLGALDRRRGSGSLFPQPNNGHRPPTAATPPRGTPEDDGGWHPTADGAAPPSGSFRCTIDRRPSITREELVAEYVDRNLPVVFSGQLLSPRWNTTARSLRRADFLARFGEAVVPVRRGSHISFDNEFGGMERRNMTVSAFVDHMLGSSNDGRSNAATPQPGVPDPWYFLDRLAVLPGVSELAPADSVFGPHTGYSMTQAEVQSTALFYLGGSGTHVSLHEHTSAWNALFFGLKRWVFLPPYDSYGALSSSLPKWEQALKSDPKRRDKVFECVQRPGEVVFVPTNWMHGVWTLAPSIGFATEVGYDQSLFTRGLAG